jgi:hypothetical protein
LGVTIALWTLRAMREGPKPFLQKAVPVWLPLAVVYSFLSAYGWPADLKVICSISASFAASLLLLSAVRDSSR